MIDIFSNLYILPLIGVLIGLFIYHIYNKVEKKYLTKRDYFKCGLLIYIVCFILLFLQQNSNVLSSITKSNILLCNTPLNSNLEDTSLSVGISKSNNVNLLENINNVNNIISNGNSINDYNEIDIDNIFNTGHPSF